MSAFGRRKSSIMARVKASECKCCECGKPAVTFFPVIDPDIPSSPYCAKCIDKAKMELAMTLWGDDKEMLEASKAAIEMIREKRERRHP